MKIVLLGKSGAGKDSMAQKLKEHFNYDFVILTTTRPMRDHESETDPYYFTTNEQFEQLIKDNELIEYRFYETLLNNKKDIWYYGINKSSIEKNKDYIITNTLEGLISLNETFKDEEVISFYLNVYDDIRETRAKLRPSFDKIEWDRRVLADEKDFKDTYKYCNYIIDNNNNDINIAFNKILKIINNKEEHVSEIYSEEEL